MQHFVLAYFAFVIILFFFHIPFFILSRLTFPLSFFCPLSLVSLPHPSFLSSRTNTAEHNNNTHKTTQYQYIGKPLIFSPWYFFPFLPSFTLPTATAFSLVLPFFLFQFSILFSSSSFLSFLSAHILLPFSRCYSSCCSLLSSFLPFTVPSFPFSLVPLLASPHFASLSSFTILFANFLFLVSSLFFS